MDLAIIETLQDIGEHKKTDPYFIKGKDLSLLYSGNFFLETTSIPCAHTSSLTIEGELKCFDNPETILPKLKKEISPEGNGSDWVLGTFQIQVSSNLTFRYLPDFIQNMDDLALEYYEVANFLFDETDENLENPYEDRFERWIHIKTLKIKEEYRNMGLGGVFFRLLEEQFGFSGSLVTLKAVPIDFSEEKTIQKKNEKIVKTFWKHRQFKKLFDDYLIYREG